MAPKPKLIWTLDEEVRCAALWNEGRPVAVIARILSDEFRHNRTIHQVNTLVRSRGAALGMIEGSSKKKKPMMGIRHSKVTETKRPPMALKRQDVPANAVPFDKLKAGRCRYPFTAGLPHMFCPDVAEPGTSWCKAHGLIVLHKAPKIGITKMKVPG